MSTAIKIENVSKLYRLGTVGTGTISHDLNRWWHTIRGKEDPYAEVGQVNDRTKAATSDKKREASSDSATPSSHSPLATRDSWSSAPDYVWALRDIKLEVRQGEILGIIGRNGAGKSTLLKLLSRVTAPTTGSIKAKGRIASLLEVGTGFHPELTGRENIYLNGAILGMKRHEIASRLDEIVEFSGCAKYLDTPVKRYSSGMMVRLGFAVAAHLECEILIIDEVLAVGDAEFQTKCLGKMRDVAASGKTILFVSHNMASMQQLCSHAIFVDHGCVTEEGTPEKIVAKYLFDTTSKGVDFQPVRSFDGSFTLRNALLKREDGQTSTVFRPGESLVVELHYDAQVPIEEPYFWVAVSGKHGPLLNANMLLDGFRPRLVSGEGFVRVSFPEIPLFPQQTYIVNVGMRYKDSTSLIFPSSAVATFRVEGTAAECSFFSPVANQHIGNSGGLRSEYQWQLSDGTEYVYNRAQAVRS